MAIRIETHSDVIRYTARRTSGAVAVSVVMAAIMILAWFGTDLAAPVAVGAVLAFGLFCGVFITTMVCGAMTYRSGLLVLELTHARRELARISRTDQLTGLLNRRGFNDAALAALESAEVDGATAAILMCDIDHFKSINDRFGHEIGDKVLVEISDVLRQFALRHGALVGRHGGEEFVAVMTGLDRDQAAHRAEEIRRDCAARTIIDGETPLPVTISIGLTTAKGGFDLADLLRTADEALYTAKRRGRDRVVEARAAA
jgi:diguanylate cyclase (GGDEF)-like protein